MAELAQKYHIHPTQIMDWKAILIKNSDSLFECKGKKQITNNAQQQRFDELLRIIGKLQVENEFLKKTLG